MDSISDGLRCRPSEVSRTRHRLANWDPGLHPACPRQQEGDMRHPFDGVIIPEAEAKQSPSKELRESCPSRRSALRWLLSVAAASWGLPATRLALGQDRLPKQPRPEDPPVGVRLEDVPSYGLHFVVPEDVRAFSPKRREELNVLGKLLRLADTGRGSSHGILLGVAAPVRGRGPASGGTHSCRVCQDRGRCRDHRQPDSRRSSGDCAAGTQWLVHEAAARVLRKWPPDRQTMVAGVREVRRCACLTHAWPGSD